MRNPEYIAKSDRVLSLASGMRSEGSLVGDSPFNLCDLMLTPDGIRTDMNCRTFHCRQRTGVGMHSDNHDSCGRKPASGDSLAQSRGTIYMTYVKSLLPAPAAGQCAAL